MWLFVFDQELLILGFFLLVLACCGMYGAFIISHKRVTDNIDKLDTKETKGVVQRLILPKSESFNVLASKIAANSVFVLTYA